MNKIDVAGLKIDTLAKSELIDKLKNRIALNQPTWVTTVYSEFLYAGLKDPGVMEMLNKADIAVPDGIGIFWAHKFLNLPLTAKSYFGKIIQSFWQVNLTLFKLLFTKKNFQTIPGSELIWDIAKMAEENNLSIYLLGGYGDTPELVAKKLASYKNDGRHLNKSLKIADYSSKNPDDPTIYEDIKKASPDILFVAYGPIRQEAWIQANLKNLPVKLAIGLGGTFDYIAKKRLNPPKFVRKMGLEWLFRLITQPYRLRRIFNATFGLITLLMRYKIFNQYPIRKNAVAVIINREGKIFLGRKTGSRVDIILNNEPEKWKNYWQLPQGGIEENEDVISAIKREAQEETGIKELDFIKLSDHTHTYLWNNALRKLSWKNRGYKFRGQTQKIAYFKFKGDSDKIVLPKNEEFVEYKWTDKNNLDKIIHFERSALTKIVQNDLKEMAEKAII